MMTQTAMRMKKKTSLQQKKKKAAEPEPMEEDEPMKIKSNKKQDQSFGNKSFGDKSFGNKSFGNESFGANKSFGRDDETGRKIFVHNVSETATYEDFQEVIEEHGECTDF